MRNGQTNMTFSGWNWVLLLDPAPIGVWLCHSELDKVVGELHRMIMRKRTTHKRVELNNDTSWLMQPPKT